MSWVMISIQCGMRRLARFENREALLPQDRTPLHGTDEGLKGESV
jgi:hypothetical protein